MSRKKASNLCATKWCRGRCEKGARKCSKCRKRKWRAANPVVSSFGIIRTRARRKGIEFSLTMEEWKEFCIETGYGTLKGVHVDRIDPTEGYYLSNMQVITSSDNIAKGNRERHSPRYQEYLARRKQALQKEQVDEDNCPF